MSRYIDADKALKDADTIDPKYAKLIEQVKNIIKAQPTADVVEVVRCKDCVYNGTLFNMPVCSLHRAPMKPDDFCSKGKLKTQEQELENDALTKELNKFGKEYVEGGLREEVDNECK